MNKCANSIHVDFLIACKGLIVCYHNFDLQLIEKLSGWMKQNYTKSRTILNWRAVVQRLHLHSEIQNNNLVLVLQAATLSPSLFQETSNMIHLPAYDLKIICVFITTICSGTCPYIHSLSTHSPSGLKAIEYRCSIPNHIS